ncbi:hypothetical protein HPB52_011486 [Rhipicephalus sanguineus]|uniref:Uncharacterized protein n=1 Tax=Rhipicephalus sanguineus TaxID=34632 RepID=A0A9D4Q6F2_RHISA|nr:hypothetical protein HPB52_011486 [Rhipicephalus sanguineus]
MEPLLSVVLRFGFRPISGVAEFFRPKARSSSTPRRKTEAIARAAFEQKIGQAVVRQLMSLTVPEDSVEEVLDFLKNTILDAMSAENTRQSTRSSSGRPPEDEALERRAAAAFRTAAFQAAGVDEPEDAVTPLSVVALMRLIEEELVTDAAPLYQPASARPEGSSKRMETDVFT